MNSLAYYCMEEKKQHQAWKKSFRPELHSLLRREVLEAIIYQYRGCCLFLYVEGFALGTTIDFDLNWPFTE